MQKLRDASVCQPRQALDQLFIRIEKIVTGRLDIVDRSRSVNACENETVVRVVRMVIDFLPPSPKIYECGAPTKAAGTKI